MKTGSKLSSQRVAETIYGDRDLQVAFPRFPCLLKELVFIPYGAEKLIILGTEMPRVVECGANLNKILDALKFLDGTRTVLELKACVAIEEAERFYGIQTLLFRLGLLQDGQIYPSDPDKELVVAFLGLHIDNTRHNRNREQALKRLASSRLAIHIDLSLVDDIDSVLREACLEDYLIITDIESLDAFSPTFILSISSDKKMSGEISRFAYERKIPSLFGQIGVSETRIGPFVLPELTASYECMLQQVPEIQAEDDPDKLLFWTTLAVQESLLLLSGVAVETHINQQFKYNHSIDGKMMSRVLLARMPGVQTSGLAHSSTLDINSSAFRAWRHHCSIRLAPKEYLPPKGHEVHYAAQNIRAYLSPIPTEYGSNEFFDLPSEWRLPAKVSWLHPKPSSAVDFDLFSVGDILRTAVGMHEVQGARRRVSPTGGGLQSSGLFIRLRSVIGIKDGWFSYDTNRHALQEVNNLDEDLLRVCLASVDDQVPLVLVTVSRLRKVCDKYGLFGYNIVQLDAGISGMFSTLVGDAFGWISSYHPEIPATTLAYGLGIDVSDHGQIMGGVITFEKPKQGTIISCEGSEDLITDLVRATAHLDNRLSQLEEGAGPSNSYPVLNSLNLQTFEQIIKTRRAVREFSEEAVDGELLEELIAIGYDAKRRLVANGALDMPFSVAVLRPIGDDKLPSGAFETTRSGLRNWKQMTDSFTRQNLRTCINQESLTGAGVVLVVVADIKESLQRYGASGYRDLLHQAGAIIAQIWLAAHAGGLVGSAAGGILDDGLRRALKADGYSKAAVFGLALGRPSYSKD